MIFLIVGLGNPGNEYDNTRHNIGARAVRRMARKRGIKFKDNNTCGIRIARMKESQREILFLLSKNYMNTSGISIARAVKEYRVELSRILVLVDDIALPFGRLRLRASGGTGGHNGLKNLQEALGSDGYARLRIGIADRSEGDLASYVLDRFLPEEEELVPEILDRAANVVECWLNEGLNRAIDALSRWQVNLPS